MAMSQKELAALFRQYHEAKLAADKVKVLSAKIKDEIRSAGKDGVDAGGFHASVSPVKGSIKFNDKALKADDPDLWAKYTYVTDDSERLNFK